MSFSVVIPSFLGSYPGAASLRDEKILRAIDSVIQQSFTDWEAIIIADGCDKTMEIVSQYKDSRIKSEKIDKAPLWSGEPRNRGIELSEKEYIVYLDIDDWLGPDHLKIIHGQLKDYDWVYFNDIVFRDDWTTRHCDISSIGKCGTSNICHKDIGARWRHTGYAHDYYFIGDLRTVSHNYSRIEMPQYYVMHMPNFYDL